MATAAQRNGLITGDSKLEGMNASADHTINSSNMTISASTVNGNRVEQHPQGNDDTTDTNNTSTSTALPPSAQDEPPSEKPKPVTPADKSYSSLSHSQKLFITIMASWAAFFSPLSANIY